MRIHAVRAAGVVAGGGAVMAFYTLQNATDKDSIELVTNLEASGPAVWAVIHADFWSDAADEDAQIGDMCVIITEEQYNEYQKLCRHAEDFERAPGRLR